MHTVARTMLCIAAVRACKAILSEDEGMCSVLHDEITLVPVFRSMFQEDEDCLSALMELYNALLQP
jgi:hypothetical protein